VKTFWRKYSSSGQW